MNPAWRWVGVASAAVLTGSFAGAQTTERVSVDSSGAQGNYYSLQCSISADGRFVAFTSESWNLVAGDTNAHEDVFVRDRQNGTTERVNISTGGAQSDGLGLHTVSISADGRFVAFQSMATNLVAGDSNGFEDVFVRDRLLGTTEICSLDSFGAQGNNVSGGAVFSASGGAVISADGTYVVFASAASNLVTGDTNNFRDIFLRDRVLGTTERVDLSASGGQSIGSSSNFSSSADGRFVAWESQDPNLVPNDTNAVEDIFVRDRQLGTTEIVSINSSGVQGNFSSLWPSISADGRFVAFESRSINLVSGDTFGLWDVFVRDRQLGTTERVSVSTAGAQATRNSFCPSISADGRYVAFMSSAPDLVSGDTNGIGLDDIFVHDRQTHTTERVSVATGGGQVDSSCWSGYSALSADGRCSVFSTSSAVLVPGDTNFCDDIFVHDRGAAWPEGFCSGDGSSTACPCANSGSSGNGCENSDATGGARLTANGSAALGSDTLVLSSSGERSIAPSIFLQGSTAIAPVGFGDGLRCVGGSLKRMYVHSASGGVVSAPMAGDLSISARSAALGDVIHPGETRYYQTYYRDPVSGFCPSPQGDGWNVSSGLAIDWSQ